MPNFPSYFRFCPHCGNSLEKYEDDGVQRRRCRVCYWIQYRNPTVGVAAVVIENNMLLLGQRRDGDWCIPCGHVEFDETIEEAVVREMLEETSLEIRPGPILSVQSNFHNLDRQTVGIWFSVAAYNGSMRAGGDLLDLNLFPVADLPPLKFPTDDNVVEIIRRRLGG